MIGIVITKSGSVIDKRAYGGDTSKVATDVAAEVAKDGTLSSQSFDLSIPAQKTAFDAVQIAPKAIDPSWSTAKATTAGALSFLGKQLGLE